MINYNADYGVVFENDATDDTLWRYATKINDKIELVFRSLAAEGEAAGQVQSTL